MTTSLITTAIPFVNAHPHLGFAYELVIADVLARHARARGRRVHFTTGTDDHSLKNVVAAARAGLTTRELVDRNAAEFHALAPLLDISIDDFISTSTHPQHRKIVEYLWCACAERGDLFRRAWHGRYCAGCEAFVDDGVTWCAEHDAAPEPVSEENWFFRLSRWADRVRGVITSGRVQIVPESARTETLAFLDGHVRDISVSRDVARAQGWGIPVPGDPSQVIYVWFDALANYISVVGLDRWRAAGQRTHVIGKGITRFHAVYWLAFLLSAELPLPDRIFVHGYLTIDSNKISKSLRRVDVPPAVDELGVDALRWFFARHCRTRRDTDVTFDDVLAAYNRDLVDGLGNLVQRCTVLASRLGVPIPDAPPGDLAAALPVRIDSARSAQIGSTPPKRIDVALRERIDAALDTFLLDDACIAIVEVIDGANAYLEATAPWRVARTDPARAAAILAAPIAAARVIARELAPFVPGVARVIGDRLHGPPRAGDPPLRRRTR